MLLAPRYGDQPVISVEVRTPGEHPVLRQRQRLAALLAELSEDEWKHASRCDGWTVQDVVTHLTSTNRFWALSIQEGVAGRPTRFLAAFDPVASPAQLVDQAQGTPVADTLEQLTSSTNAMASVIDALGDADWEALAEAPPGHLTVREVADHALWDCWVHERDIILPLGRPATVEPDEVLTSLRYAAALGRAFEVCAGSMDTGAVILEIRNPQAQVVVERAGDAVRVHDVPPDNTTTSGEGDAVELLEMLSMRDVGAPVPAAVRVLTAGLAVVFDQSTSV